MTTRFQIKGNATLRCKACGKRLGETGWTCEVAVGAPIMVEPWAQICMLHKQETGCDPMGVTAALPIFHIEEMH